MKKLVALMAAIVVLCMTAMADMTVEVGQYNGEEVYMSLQGNGLHLRLNLEKGCYETDGGVIWQAAPIPFGTLQQSNLPYTERQVRNMNKLYAALADASGFWDKPAEGRGRLAVYSAPDETSYRGADGKAAVELPGGVRLMMTLDGWSMIEYDVNRTERRIGWVKTAALGSAPVMLTDIPVTLYEGAMMTDDPRGWRDLMPGRLLGDVHLLAQLDALWGYVRAEKADGQAVWGFIPLCDIRLTENADTKRMTDLAGTWQFSGGGNLLPDVFALQPDGTGDLAGVAVEWAAVDGTAGYQHDLRLTEENGRVTRLHLYRIEDDVLTLSLGEAGGSWKRISE